MTSTRYKSFGVGLPFLASDGNFRREGNDFIMENINRPIQQLDLRPGVGTQLTIKFEDEIIPIYEIVKTGELVRVMIKPRYKYIYQKIGF